MHYQEQVEKALGTHQHSNLRTCFDLYSSELNETSLEKKATILHRCVTTGLSVEYLVRGYTKEYSKLKGSYAVKDVHLALAAILNDVFTREDSQNPFLK